MSGRTPIKFLAAIIILYLLLLASACQRRTTVCPEGSVTYFPNPASLLAGSSSPNSELNTTPAVVEIRGKMTEVDRVIRGPICEGTWSGTIYVACDIQVTEWQDAPLFLEQCPLTIEPKTTIYVAAHNDTAYYKGCSCHTGELAEH